MYTTIYFILQYKFCQEVWLWHEIFIKIFSDRKTFFKPEYPAKRLITIIISTIMGLNRFLIKGSIKMAETGTVKIKNGKIEFVKFGKGKKPLVILPGLSYDGFFDKAAEIERAYAAFADEFTVCLIDRNLTPEAGYSVKDMADDTAEALNKLGVLCADFFGASLGGMVAQTLAIDYPQLVNKLVLGSTLSRPNDAFLKNLTRWEDLAKNGDIISLFDDMNKKIYSDYTLKKYAAVFAAIKPEVTAEKTARFVAYIGAAKNVDTYNSLNKIKAETLVIGASKDKVTTAAAAREIAEKLHCKYHEYKKYGHAVFDEAAGYKKRVYDFLT